jgi:hypothetical protein
VRGINVVRAELNWENVRRFLLGKNLSGIVQPSFACHAAALCWAFRQIDLHEHVRLHEEVIGGKLAKPIGEPTGSPAVAVV